MIKNFKFNRESRLIYMELKNSISQICNEVSGKVAWNWIRLISGYHRIKASKDYESIMLKIKDFLEGLDLDSLKVHEFPADGKTQSWNWTPSYGWDVTSGELWQMTPEIKRICFFQENPLCLVTHSRSCDITGQLVDIGQGEPSELENRDLTQKILLVEGGQHGRIEKLMKTGALGIISYPSAEKVGPHLDLHIYDAYLPTQELLEKISFGFSLTRNQGLDLHNQLKSHEITLRAKIQAEIYPSTLKVLDAQILGAEDPDQTILFISHLCHPSPGANDNASGAAGLIEIVRSITNLINTNKISKPKRTLEFLWVDEYMGTVPWTFKFQKKLQKTLVCINLDMIGENQMKLNSRFLPSLAPYSNPSIVNDLISYIVPLIADNPKCINSDGTKAPMRYKIIPYSGGSDHTVFNDAFFGIPGFMFGHDGDEYYHSSRDELEYSDPTEIQRILCSALWVGVMLANLTCENMENLWGILDQCRYWRKGVLSSLLHQLGTEIHDVSEKTEEIQEKVQFGFNLIAEFIAHEKRILRSYDVFGPVHQKHPTKINQIESELNFWEQMHISEWNDIFSKNAKKSHSPLNLETTYKRIMTGPITFDALQALETTKLFQDLIQNQHNPPDLDGLSQEIINFASKNLNLSQISAMISMEFNSLYFPSKVSKILGEIIDQQILEKK